MQTLRLVVNSGELLLCCEDDKGLLKIQEERKEVFNMF